MSRTAAHQALACVLRAATQHQACSAASQLALREGAAVAGSPCGVRAAGHSLVRALMLGRPSLPGLAGLRLSSSSSTAAAAATAAAKHVKAAAAASPAAAAELRGLRRLMREYKMLSKAKLSTLVVLTASAGFVAGSGEAVDYAQLAWTSLGTFGAAACANTLNQLYEIRNDRLMSRTCNRPLPAGRLTPLHAAAFAAVMGAAGLGLLYTQTNGLTTALGAANIALYAGIYTPLKQLSVVNTWVGAVVGAIPPLMGWASASGSLEPGAWVLAGALFAWQMPHFMALAWLCKDDYVRGGFRMLSMVDTTGRRTAMVALRYTAALLPVGAAAVALGVATEPFAWEAAALVAVLAAPAVRFVSSPSTQSARKLFRYSLMYLPLLLLGLAVHRLPNKHDVTYEAVLADTVAGAGRGFQAVAGAVAAPLSAASAPAPPALDQRQQQQGVAVALAAVAAVAASAARRSYSAVSGHLVANNIKCPSKVYGDAGEDMEVTEGGLEGSGEGQQQEQQQGTPDVNKDAAGDGPRR